MVFWDLIFLGSYNQRLFLVLCPWHSGRALVTYLGLVWYFPIIRLRFCITGKHTTEVSKYILLICITRNANRGRVPARTLKRKGNSLWSLVTLPCNLSTFTVALHILQTTPFKAHSSVVLVYSHGFVISTTPHSYLTQASSTYPLFLKVSVLDLLSFYADAAF